MALFASYGDIAYFMQNLSHQKSGLIFDIFVFLAVSQGCISKRVVAVAFLYVAITRVRFFSCEVISKQSQSSYL